MKRIVVGLITCLVLIACKKVEETPEVSYASFGDKITAENALTKKLASEEFGALKVGDTITLKFSSTINEVCKDKGCWMKIDLGNEKESMVRFKNYGFFVPKDVDNKEVIVNGKAYVAETSVDLLRHYAEDGGKTQEEIEAITEPEFTYAFEADGVLIKD